MTISTVLGYDAIRVNVAKLPAGKIVVGGYVTGSGNVPWGSAEFAKYPGAVRIDQTPASTPWDDTADVDDYENGTVTLSELAPRAKARLLAFKSGKRPGQRSPVVYCSASNVTTVVNALIAGGVTSGIGLWVAHFGVTEAEATGAVANGSGPFPIVGFQFSDQGAGGAYDLDVFSVPWLTNVSKAPSTAPVPASTTPMPPGQWNNPSGWEWSEVSVAGLGMDGKMHLFVLNADNQWVKAFG